ncbi:ComC/BlpC family leader-containing pheromone/bacteriocin [Streptococcus himalayensis]|uniref:Uncharacterized protein n=1 Tax=Streptococcus himalayensis TaxID=1888195 RepID=A0A917EEG5_9STRE|nr:ComC/BlpC family leader-containing pheromone/bacteriocin [Streptococcus himalayensis]GGE23983.1 hypothetical protein GCM10011510_01370 [Streptococcus himalayensis]
MKTMEKTFKGLAQFEALKSDELKQTIGGDMRKINPVLTPFFRKK